MVKSLKGDLKNISVLGQLKVEEMRTKASLVTPEDTLPLGPLHSHTAGGACGTLQFTVS